MWWRCGLVLALTASVAFGEQPSTNLPLRHWAYPILDRFSAKGLIDLDLEPLPLSRNEIAQALDQLLRRVEREPSIFSPGDRYLTQKLATEFEAELRLQDQPRAAGKPIMLESEEEYVLYIDYNLSHRQVLSEDARPDPLTTLELSTRGVIRSSLAFDQALDVLYTRWAEENITQWTRPEQVFRKGAFGELPWGYMVMDLPWCSAEVGRDQVWWGPGRKGALLVSENSRYFDMVAFRFNFRRLRAMAFTSVLDTDQNLFLAGHRLSFVLPKGIRLGLSETVLYQAPRPVLLYMQPLMPYVPAQMISDRNDNIFWSFDVVATPWKGVELYGEILIDDYQYEHDPNDPTPDKLGALVGVFWVDPGGMRDTDLRVEYAAIDKWVYSHKIAHNEYVHLEEVIGHPAGPDGDRFDLEVTFRPHPRVELWSNALYTRKGEGTSSVPYEAEGGSLTPPFPSGIVEKRQRIAVGSAWEPLWWCRLSAEVGREKTTNVGHVEGQIVEGSTAAIAIEINM